MANSKTEICNLALDLLSAGSVTDIDSPVTAQDALLSRWYDKSRRKLLREHPWNFAVVRAALAASTTAPTFGYTQQFPLPADFVRMLTVETSDGVIILPKDYEIEYNNLLFEAEDGVAYIRYIFDIQDVSRFDELFVDVLVCEIALGIAFRTTDGNKNVERIAALLEKKLSKAKAIDGQENPPRSVVKSPAIETRRLLSSTRSDRIMF